MESLGQRLARKEAEKAARNAPPVGPDPTDPTRHFDGQHWLKWDGAEWLPEQVKPQSRLLRAQAALDAKVEDNKAKEQARADTDAVAAADRKAAAATTREPAGWWANVPKMTVAVNVRNLGVKTMTKSMALGTLKVTDEGLQWRANLGPKTVIRWAVIEGIDVDGETTKRLTATRVVALGVFALGAKKSSADTTVTVMTPDKEYAFLIEKTQPVLVRNKMRPLLSALAASSEPATIETPAAGAPAGPDPAEQLHKLAELRDAGILTEEEFAAKKAEILARM